ncbi:MAG TPA: ABC transporter ATP-binding protein [Acidimicrobiales bacterium]|nr:ABC transporter ATP-binding protein [Acidimicrobiales bacterium]
MGRPVVVADHVSKKYRLYRERNASIKAAVMRGGRAKVDVFWALDDVSLEVSEGSTTGLIGANGSGKSTMLKCLAKILRPDKGAVSTTGKMSALLELGAGFHPELTGRENVFLNGAILGLKQKELVARFDDIVDFAGIGQFIDEPVKNYSSGMYVRLGFSVAINVQPDILLVDEVLAVGDEAFQRKCLERFTELKRNGKTVIIVSHSMQSVVNMCDHAIWFQKGHKMADGEPKEVVEAYTGSIVLDEHRPAEKGDRWGSGEARIERVELLDGEGREITRIKTGDPLTFRLSYAASEPIEQPVFSVSVQTLQGVVVTNPTTREAEKMPEKIDGSGRVELRLPRFPLQPGTYDVTVSLTDFTMAHPYDVRRNVVRLDVDRKGPVEPGGLVALGGKWEIDA